MIGAGVIWGLVIATFAGVFATMDPAHTQFANTMDDLNRFMGHYGFEKEVRQKLREYFYQSKHLQLTQTNNQLLSLMSPKLRGEAAIRINGWLKTVWFLKSAEPEFLVNLALAVEPLVFAPGELIPPGFMYVVRRGKALYDGKVLRTGFLWGEDMIMQSAHLRRSYHSSALSYLEVFSLAREKLLEVASGFPLTSKHLRKCAIKLALRLEVVFLARGMKRIKSPLAVLGARTWMSRATAAAQKTSDKHLLAFQGHSSSSVCDAISEGGPSSPNPRATRSKSI
eukprot:3267825-Prymnesium_polylepis.1